MYTRDFILNYTFLNAAGFPATTSCPSSRLWVWQIGGVCGLGKGKMEADRRFTTLSNGNCVVNMHSKAAKSTMI